MKKILLLLSILTFLNCEAIFEDNISNLTVEVLSPVDHAVIEDNDVVFAWQTVNGADAYRLQIAKPNFLNATKIVLDTLLQQSLIEVYLEPSDYQWKIVGENSEYQTEERLSSFTIN